MYHEGFILKINLNSLLFQIIIERVWNEIDTVEDYEKALIEFEVD